MILVTHIDLDGVGCEIVAKSFFPELEPEKIFHFNYDYVNDGVLELLETTDEKIWISDLSLNSDMAELVEQKYKNRVLIFDHHKTAKHLEKYSFANIDLEKSGTLILFDYLRKKIKIEVPENLSTFVFHVNDYDMWHHTSPYSSQINDLLTLLGINIFSKTIFDRIKNNEPLISESDKNYLKALEIKKKNYLKRRVAASKVMDNRIVLIASCFISEMAQYIRDYEEKPENWKDVEYIDIINIEKKNHSLRSYKDGFDVSAVALANGGGGHPAAAGYPINISDISRIFDIFK